MQKTIAIKAQVVVNQAFAFFSHPLNSLASKIKNIWEKAILGHLQPAMCDLFSRLNMKLHSLRAQILPCQGIKNHFTKREITLLRTPFPFISRQETKTLPVQKMSPLKEEGPSTSLLDEDLEEIQKEKPSPPLFSQSLEEMRSSLREISRFYVDQLYETQIEKKVASLQKNASSLPLLIQSFAQEMIEIGNQATKPIFQKFVKQKEEWIDPAFQKMLKTLLKRDGKGDDSQELSPLYALLENQLSKEFKNTSLPPDQNLQRDYIQPILAWLISSDRSIPFTQSMHRQELHQEELTHALFERSLEILVERKIAYYTHIVENTLQDRLGTIVHEMLRINADQVTDFFSKRLCALITELPFPETFDAVIHQAIHPHIEAMSQAYQAQKEHRDLLQKASQLSQIDPKNPEEIGAKAEALKYLHRVKEQGGEEPFLRRILIESYTKNPIFHPMLQHALSLGKDPISPMKRAQSAIYAPIADQLFDLMLPTKKRINAQGAIEEIDPLAELWETLYLPQEIESLFLSFSELIEEFATKETISLLGNIQTPALTLLKNIFQTHAKDLLKKELANSVQIFFQKTSDLDTVDELAANAIFPLINEKLLQLLIEEKIGNNLPRFAELFHAMLIDPSCDHEGKRQKLQKIFIEEVTQSFKHFDPKSFYATPSESEPTHLKIRSFTEKEWSSVALPILQELEKRVESSLLLDPKRTSVEEILKVFSRDFESKSSENNPIYGEIAANLLWKLGNFPHETLLRYFLKKSVSEQMTASLHPIRKDAEWLVQALTEGLQSSLLDQTQGQENHQTLLTKEKLAHEIDLTAKLSYELIELLAEKQGFLPSLAFRKLIIHTPDELKNLIYTIYRKILQEKVIAENGTVLFCMELLRAFSQASDALQTQENLS